MEGAKRQRVGITRDRGLTDTAEMSTSLGHDGLAGQSLNPCDDVLAVRDLAQIGHMPPNALNDQLPLLLHG